MPRRLFFINVVLVGVSVACIALIVKQLLTSRPVVTPRSRPPGGSTAEVPPAGDSRLPPQAYNVIASRNLFSPTRSETAGPGIAGASTPVLIAKPALHGVVLREGSPIAYLEDPLTKRIAGYRIGDPIAGGTLQTISADAVVIARPEGMVDVRLRDPAKPRPAAAQPGVQPGAPGQPPMPGAPPPAGAVQPPPQGVMPMPSQAQPPRAFTPSGVPVPQQAQPIPPAAIQQLTPGQPIPSIPFGRPSPSLGRRMPPVDSSGQPTPAPTQ